MNGESYFRILPMYILLFRIVSETSEIFLSELYSDLIDRFCRIADNQFRKDLISKMRKTKTERLRKRVDTKQNTSSVLTMKIIFNDKSDAKQSTHFKLKSYIFDHGKSCFSSFVKNDLLKLCKAYEIEASSGTTNDVIKQKLCSIIPSADGVSFPEYLNETTSQATTETDETGSKISRQEQPEHSTSSEQSVASSSTAQTHSSEPAKSYVQKQKKRRGKTKLATKSKKCKKSKSTAQSSNMDDTDTVCPLCKTVYAEGEDWVACNTKHNISVQPLGWY